MSNELLEQVKAVAHQINVGVSWKDLEIESQAEEWDVEIDDIVPASVFFDNEVLDHNFEINGDGSFKSGKVLVAFGGPNIWVNFSTGQVEGFWGGDKATAPIFSDAMDIEFELEERWGWVK